MTTSHPTDSHHFLHWSPVAIMLAAVAILSLSAATIEYRRHANSLLNPFLLRTKVVVPARLPFTAQEVQSFFALKIGTAPERFDNTTVIPQPTTMDDFNDYEVAVTSEVNGGLAVEFRGTGDAALSLAKGFVRSALFQPKEAAALESMVEQRRRSPAAPLPRFKADLRIIELIDLYRLTIRFQPLDR